MSNFTDANQRLCSWCQRIIAGDVSIAKASVAGVLFRDKNGLMHFYNPRTQASKAAQGTVSDGVRCVEDEPEFGEDTTESSDDLASSLFGNLVPRNFEESSDDDDDSG